jgi:mannose-6-phosphate isomerase-like protein (cupin superfamily)
MDGSAGVGSLSHFSKESRPWGNFERFTLNEATTVKIITVKEGEGFSLQTHAHRDEFWRILSGSGTLVLGDTTLSAAPGDAFYCPRGTRHRATGGKGGLQFLEIAFGDFDESDIARLEDKYGRA